MAVRASGGRRGAAFYKQLIERRAREGLTWAQAASAGGACLSTLYRWAHRLRAADEGAFIELPCPAAPWPGTEIVLSGGRVLRVPAGAPPAGLLELVQLLERAC